MDVSEIKGVVKICDRCGKAFRDIEQIARKKIDGCLVLYSCDTDEGEQHLDLCNKCYTELSDWYCAY